MRVGKPAVAAAVATLLATGSGARAVSKWFYTGEGSSWHVCDAEAKHCDIKIKWSISNEDKYDKWRICWKPKESGTWLDDHCDYHSLNVPIDANEAVLPSLSMELDYRIKLEGRKDRNEKWVCVLKGIITSVGYHPILHPGGVCVNV